MISVINRTTRRCSQLTALSLRHFSNVTKCDALVLGGGIAGASMSYRLAKLHNLDVICLEKEESPGYHATGKAFGIFSQTNAQCIQSKLLTTASRTFFESPDEECVNSYIRDNYEDGILSKTGLVAISSPDDYAYLYEHFGPTEHIKFNQNIQVMPQSDVTNMIPFLQSHELAPYAIYEPNAANFNIGLVYEHFLVGCNNFGVKYYFNQSAVEMSKNSGGNWDVLSYNAERNSIDRFEAGILVNCTGQWCDETAVKAGITPIDLVSEKRNVIVFTYSKSEEQKKETSFQSLFQMKHKPEELNEEQSPWLGWISRRAGEIFHSCFQGGNGVFLYDPTTESEENSDSGIDEMEIVMHKLAKYTTLKVHKVASKAAGIRCFSKYDKDICIGPSVEDSSFIFCNALGSLGVQTAPAYSDIASYLAVGKDLPQSYVDLGIDVSKLKPERMSKNEVP